MKTVPILAGLIAFLVLGGCGLESTKVTVRVVEHKLLQGGYYAILYQVLQPKDLEGRYGMESTLRRDLISEVDGREYELYLHLSEVGALLQSRPLDYSTSPPGKYDFLDSAKRVVPQRAER
ncbi:hypothetical protein [Xanthomonas sp. SI]|uniref:hypothetical protein n=1 Tax=Xanthomonas sp. SI TaxID=2724123 RepID=UPI00163B05CD|nr:hypothetical protein [Xanthomonas sp. SI]